MTILDSLGAWVSVAFGLAFAYPWAVLILADRRRFPVLLALVTVGLSLGTLTWGMMVYALIFPGALNFTVVLAGEALVFGVGTWLLLESASVPDEYVPTVALKPLANRAVDNPIEAASISIVVIIAILIAFNAVYWPFSDDDALAIYSHYGWRMFRERALPDDGLYDAYPMLLPYAYAYTHMAAGRIDEYMARFIPAVMAIGALGAAYELGREFYGHRAGVAAALLLAITPDFTRWASSGYADVPVSFYVTLTAVFAWRLYRYGGPREAVMAGVMAGLALWTKNSAITLPISFPLFVALAALMDRGGGRFPFRWRDLWLAVASFLVVAGPWYGRNLALYGYLMPPTAWTWMARHDLANLFPFVTDRWAFFPSGVAYTLGLIWVLAEALDPTGSISSDGDVRRRAVSLLSFALPFGAAWWMFASYDTRFLLAVLPIVAVMAGRLVDVAADALKAPRWKPVVRYALVILIVVAALPAARKAVLFKWELLRHPLMSDEYRHRLVTGYDFEVAQYILNLPPDARVLAPGRTLIGYYAGLADVVERDVSSREELAGYDYWISMGPPPDFLEPGDLEQLAQIGDYRIYAVRIDDDGDR